VLLAVKVEEPKPRRTLGDVASTCARVARRDKSLDDKKVSNIFLFKILYVEKKIYI
jgi:hypothetical protein